MFTKTIDNKPSIKDPNGNYIVDLATPIFNENAGEINSYNVVKMTSFFEMRPDLVALNEYSDVDATEYILKYSGISNPFSLYDDDILMIPNRQEADDLTESKKQDNGNNESVQEAQIRNFFRYVNTDYKEDTTSYQNLANKHIPSAVQTPTDNLNGNFIVPYISEDGNTAITIKNGRMYFGTDAGFNVTDVIKASTTDVDAKIQAIIDSTATAMSDSNCMYNGTTLANFVRATVVDNFANKLN